MGLGKNVGITFLGIIIFFTIAPGILLYFTMNCYSSHKISSGVVDFFSEQPLVDFAPSGAIDPELEEVFGDITLLDIFSSIYPFAQDYCGDNQDASFTDVEVDIEGLEEIGSLSIRDIFLLISDTDITGIMDYIDSTVTCENVLETSDAESFMSMFFENIIQGVFDGSSDLGDSGLNNMFELMMSMMNFVRTYILFFVLLGIICVVLMYVISRDIAFTLKKVGWPLAISGATTAILIFIAVQIAPGLIEKIDVGEMEFAILLVQQLAINPIKPLMWVGAIMAVVGGGMIVAGFVIGKKTGKTRAEKMMRPKEKTIKEKPRIDFKPEKKEKKPQKKPKK